MKIRKFHHHSRFLDRPMPTAIYGHFGAPLLAFPTAAADFEEFERQGMVEALAPFIEGGIIKLITIDSINGVSWSDKSVSITEAARLHQSYDEYVYKEVAPLIWEDCQGKLPIATMGASFGAYHAANTFLKHPDVFRTCYGLSGIYDISDSFGDSFDHNCYLNSPRHYLPNLKGTPQWDAIASGRLVLIVGQGPWERVHWTTWFADYLDGLGVPHTLDLWGQDVAHDWPWWFKQMNLYLGRDFGQPG